MQKFQYLKTRQCIALSFCYFFSPSSPNLLSTIQRYYTFWTFVKYLFPAETILKLSCGRGRELYICIGPLICIKHKTYLSVISLISL